MTLTERLEPVLDYFTNFHYAFFLGEAVNVPAYRELTFLQRLGMWTGVTCAALIVVLLGTLAAAIVFAGFWMLWTTAPGVVLLLFVLALIVSFLAWKVKL